MSKHPMTVEGRNKMAEELEYIKVTKRQEITKAIAVAREFGDLKENAEYHAAKEQQRFNEGKIQDLEGKLANSQVIDPKSLDVQDKVVFGCYMKLVNAESKKENNFQIVGEDEANVEANKISYLSPISKGLMGKMVGDIIDIKTPNGEVVYEIIEVSY